MSNPSRRKRFAISPRSPRHRRQRQPRALGRGRALQELRAYAGAARGHHVDPGLARAARLGGRPAPPDRGLSWAAARRCPCKISAWRRISSATIGGWVEMVEITVTRTPRR